MNNPSEAPKIMLKRVLSVSEILAKVSSEQDLDDQQPAPPHQSMQSNEQTVLH